MKLRSHQLSFSTDIQQHSKYVIYQGTFFIDPARVTPGASRATVTIHLLINGHCMLWQYTGRVELDDRDGFEWDESNRDKNSITHQVSMGEREDIFFNLPILLQPEPAHSQTEAMNYVFGQTNARRRLFIALTVRNNKVRVILARGMSKQERAVYAQEYP